MTQKEWELVSHTLGPPTEHHLNATAYLSIVAEQVHPFTTVVSPSSEDEGAADKSAGTV